MQQRELLRPLMEVEVPLCRVLAAMEHAGVGLAPGQLQRQRGPLRARLAQLAQRAHEAAGAVFDINSPKVKRSLVINWGSSG